MDGGSRTTRKLRYREARRLTHRQRGGSAIIVPMDLPANDPRIVILRELLSSDEELKFILPAEGATPIDDATKAKHYYTIIRRQDDILQATLNTIYRMLEITSDPPTPDEIISKWITIKDNITEKQKIYNLVKYVRDIIVLNTNDKVKVSIVSGGSKAATVTNRPKLDNFIFTETSPDAISGMDILGVMLYPKRLSNIFVEGVVNIIIELSTNSTTALDTISKTPIGNVRDTLIKLLSTQYESYIKSISYLETNNVIRDYISIMSNSPSKQEIIPSFFNNFITTAINKDLPKIDKTITAGALAGLVFKFYKKGQKANITERVLRIIKDKGIKSSRMAKDNIIFGLPDPKYNSYPIISDITFNDIMDSICNPASAEGAETFHFLLHLLYKLETYVSSKSEPTEEDIVAGVATLHSNTETRVAAAAADAPVTASVVPAAAAPPVAVVTAPATEK